MKLEILKYLICPACLPEENPLHPEHCQRSGEEISEGALQCSRCGQAYPIKRGVARLVTGIGGRMSDPAEILGNPTSDIRHPISDTSSPASVYESPEVLSAYLWSHYADLFEDPDANRAYSEWAALISPSAGAVLDAGCAVGRFCFEMSCKYDLAIGVDLSENFVHTARRLMEERTLSFRLKEEGCIRSERTFLLPDRWDSKKVEFIVADANALPFRSESFACVASLNLIDKIARPLEHLCEAQRSARLSNAQLLISDPFSWSETACNPDRWLGGAPAGRFAGFGIDNLAGLLSGQIDPQFPGERGQPPSDSPTLSSGRKAGAGGRSSEWKIARTGSVWWKIRNHRNHFELIRSLFVKAER